MAKINIERIRVKQEVEAENSKGYFEVLHMHHMWRGFLKGCKESCVDFKLGWYQRRGDAVFKSLQIKAKNWNRVINARMLCIQYLAVIVGFIILEKLDSSIVKGEANIKGTLRIERRLMVSIATFEKIRDTR